MLACAKVHGLPLNLPSVFVASRPLEVVLACAVRSANGFTFVIAPMALVELSLACHVSKVPDFGNLCVAVPPLAVINFWMPSEDS